MEPVVDLLMICALVYVSGGPFSQARAALFAPPLVAAIRLRPWLTAAWALLAVIAYVAVSLPHPALHDQDAAGQVLVGACYLGWVGLAAVALSTLLRTHTERLRRLADERRSLVRQALESESRARRRLGAFLHDQPVQTLLLAAQELEEARRGDARALDRAETAVRTTVAQLRSEISELHSHVLDHAGLCAALDDLAQRWSRRAGIAVCARVDPGATGRHDALILAAASELVANAAHHGAPERIVITVKNREGNVALRVADDGRGMDPQTRADAVAQGRIGLASLTERVQALGGRLEIGPVSGSGTVVTAIVPRRP
ncbi:hypothetical protein FSW04_15225 [Baekduia soli]|uniref:histidine kinase n=1 Tax=Baekduia soli TaxID=496014 RepID=A0A5B8U7Y4_9ACTN|nr:ATP-binding protein [Baekduia soli]QEC48792.1 hypothetical protein FSW04_15225 [Baekduia soli]